MTIKRSRSNDGVRSSVRTVLPIDDGLMRSLLASFPVAQREKSKPHVYHGPVRARGCPKSPITDDQVLAIRRMREWLGMSVFCISKATGIGETTVQNFCDYVNRGHLDPGPRPAPKVFGGMTVVEA